MCRIAGVVIVAALALGNRGAVSAPVERPRDTLEGAGDSRHRNTDARLWHRRLTIRELEAAARRTPRDVESLDRLGEAYYDGGFFHRAREAFERALDVDSTDADAHFGLGRICQREWLDAPESDRIKAAAAQFEAAVRTRPAFYEALVAWAVVRFERRDPWAAREAAMAALSIAPDRVEAQLAAAFLAYRTGLVERSDSLFDVAIPRCPRGIAERFSDITPLLSEVQQQDLEELGATAKREYARRFWSRSDPDPTTPQNEARLEFWSRLSHALLLIGDPWSPKWQARTDLYSRYGRLVQIEREFDSDRSEMPHVAWGEVAVDPTPQALERLGQNATGGGHAVFAPLPPGALERPFESMVSRFEGRHGARLSAMVETPGTPVDSIVADCVVIGPDDRVVARETRALSPSACDPAEQRAGEFTFELPPGRYRVAFAVRDAAGGRGVGHVDKDIVPVSSGLTMSDLVLACGPTGATPQGSIALTPNMLAQVEGAQSLLAYFEVYHLGQDESGANRFEYEYTVGELRGRPSQPPSRKNQPGRGASRLSFRSTQEGVGPLRRQFITVPAVSLPPGRYRLTITVSDQLAGTKTTQWADFVKVKAEQ